MSNPKDDELPDGFRFALEETSRIQGTSRIDRPENYDQVVRFIPEVQVLGLNDGTILDCGLVRPKPVTSARKLTLEEIMELGEE
jgi:hypothetical protein